MDEGNHLSPPALAGVQLTERDHLSRGDVLLKGVLATAGLYGLGAIAPFVRRALADSSSDIERLNFLLSFEYMQQTLYTRGQSEKNDKNEKMPLKPEEKKLIDFLVTQEGEHVAAMEKMVKELGGKPESRWNQLAFSFRIYETLLQLAGEVETASVGAFNGGIPTIESKEARELAFSIVQVDGRHAATVLIPQHQEPAPEAFDLGTDETSAISNTEQFTGAFAE